MDLNDNFQPFLSDPQQNNVSFAQTDHFISHQSQENSNLISTNQDGTHFSNQYDSTSTQSQQTFQPYTQTTNDSLAISQRPVHINNFFYQPYNDFLNYHVKCEKIFDDSIIQLLNQPLRENEFQCIFFHRQLCDNQFYQITCEIVSPSLVNCCLNKNIYGAEIEQNMKQEQLAFTSSYQRENLRYHLELYLSNQLLY